MNESKVRSFYFVGIKEIKRLPYMYSYSKIKCIYSKIHRLNLLRFVLSTKHRCLQIVIYALNDKFWKICISIDLRQFSKCRKNIREQLWKLSTNAKYRRNCMPSYFRHGESDYTECILNIPITIITYLFS